VPTIQVRADLTAEELLTAASQLERDELDRFVSRLLSLRAQRLGRCLPAQEGELLGRINHGLSRDEQQRLDELTHKRDGRALTPEEHQELLRLSDRVEMLQAERAAALVELARLRGVTLEALMDELGIPGGADG
jgi:hypothetical protein